MTLIYDQEEHRNLNRRFLLSKIKTNLSLFLIGVVLFASPGSLNYLSTFHDWTDKILSLIIMLFSLLACFNTKFGHLVSLCGCTVLYFSTVNYSPAVFANSGILGFIIISISLISSKRPVEMEVGPTIPENLTYNPSSFDTRFLGTCFLVTGLVGVRYFTQFYSSNLFSCLILTCTLAFICKISGGKHRWHTQPLMAIATFFMSLISIILTLTMFILFRKIEFFYGYLLFLLTTAFSFDEMQTSLIYVLGEDKKNRRIQALFQGSEFYRMNTLWEEKSTESLVKAIKNCINGTSFPSNLIFVFGVGIGLIIIPKTFIAHLELHRLIEICGLTVTAFTVLSFTKSLRILRFFNLLPAFLLIISPIIFHIPPQSNDFLATLSAGFAIGLCSIRKGFVEEKI